MRGSERYRVVPPSDAPPWFNHFATDLALVLARISSDLNTPEIPKASLPLDGSRTVARVPDEAGGYALAFFDGTEWRRSTDNAVVS